MEELRQQIIDLKDKIARLERQSSILNIQNIIRDYFISPTIGIAIGEDVISSNSAAILEIKSTSRGILLPRMTTAQVNAISNPPEGLMVYDNNDSEPAIHKIKVYDGSNWRTVTFD